LNQPQIAPNSRKKSLPAQPARHVSLGKKEKSASLLFLFSFLSSPNKQKTHHQSESNPITSWTPSPSKTSLSYTVVKTTAPFIPARLLQRYLHETAEDTGE
jgi:hypothetical protein